MSDTRGCISGLGVRALRSTAPARCFFGINSTFSAWIIDFSTTPPMPIVVPPLYEPESPLTYNATGLFGTDGIRAICHCPEAGVVGGLCKRRTGRHQPRYRRSHHGLATGGTAVLRATLRKTGIRNGTWGRFRYYPARKALVLLASADKRQSHADGVAGPFTESSSQPPLFHPRDRNLRLARVQRT